MPLRPTPQQQAVIDSTAKLLVVKALAGAGKTSSLDGYARARPKARMLYLAYNKAMEVAASGRFPSNVTCKTVHALAYRRFGRRFQDAGKLGNVRASDVMMALDFDAMLAKHALETVNNFIYSADRRFAETHVPESVAPQRRPIVFDRARALWKAMMDLDPASTGPKVNMTHDGYLKLFHLNCPDLSKDYDVILLDEAQDSNPVTAAIVVGQQCTRVLVGDSHQSIYGFRKSTDALESAALLPGAEVAYLTHSFRFGPDVAAIATTLLAGFKGETLPLVGRGPSEPLKLKVDRAKPHTVLCRTNAQVFTTAAELLGKRKFHFVGGIDSYPFERLLDVQRLAAGEKHQVRDPFFKMLGSLDKLQDYAESIQDVEVRGLLRVQKDYGTRIPGLITSMRREAVSAEEAVVTLTTAHRSKGLEFDQVVLAEDFGALEEDGVPLELEAQEDIEELNLLYVAVTRAIHALEVNETLARALMALGKDSAFQLPAGTEQSPIVAKMVGRGRLPVAGDTVASANDAAVQPEESFMTPAGAADNTRFEAKKPRPWLRNSRAA